MIAFVKRNLKVFFKDKASVVFSLLAVFIVIGLYALFLGDTMMNSGFGALKDGKFLMNSWLVAGLLAITPVTSTMGAFGTLIADKENKIIKDFKSAPVENYKLVGGYLLSVIVIGCIMSLICLTFCEIYIVASGGKLLGAAAFLKTVALILLASVSSSCLMFFIVSFIKSLNAFSAVNIILGTLIGFLTGTYIPVAGLPSGVQPVVKCFPPSHAASLFRQIMMGDALKEAFAGASAEALTDFRTDMGIVYLFGGREFPVWGSVLVLLLSAALFFGFSVLLMSRKNKQS